MREEDTQVLAEEVGADDEEVGIDVIAPDREDSTEECGEDTGMEEAGDSVTGKRAMGASHLGLGFGRHGGGRLHLSIVTPMGVGEFPFAGYRSLDYFRIS